MLQILGRRARLVEQVLLVLPVKPQIREQPAPRALQDKQVPRVPWAQVLLGKEGRLDKQVPQVVQALRVPQGLLDSRALRVKRV